VNSNPPAQAISLRQWWVENPPYIVWKRDIFIAELSCILDRVTLPTVGMQQHKPPISALCIPTGLWLYQSNE